MSSQRYQRLSRNADDHESPVTQSPRRQDSHTIPTSPPPSFRSQASSPHRRSISDRDPLVSDADRNLADTFDAPSDSDSDDDGHNSAGLDNRQRIMSGRPDDAELGTGVQPQEGTRVQVERRVTHLPIFAPATSATRYGGGNAVHDGVFANLSAKPGRGEDLEEKPPTYEQAAADATPPYWENTIFAPSGSTSDEVYIDGLPVGSFFSFIWNGMISMSFQLVGFLLTYLLHSTHAAKTGSKAGLGITLIQYGFSLRGATSIPDDNGDGNSGNGENDFTTPPDPNNHNFDPNALSAGSGDGAFIPSGGDATGSESTGIGAMRASDWFAYTLMIVGWFVLIRAISEYLKARRHEALVLQSPSRGLNLAVVAEGEEPARSV